LREANERAGACCEPAFLGAFIGVWLARLLHLPLFIAVAVGGYSFPIVWSLVGGLVLVTITRAGARPYDDRALRRPRRDAAFENVRRSTGVARSVERERELRSG
jgi:hypothetical protein